ncbi:MAG TPA: peptidylprolyl isomerase [Gammaproteobacteria bacterium]
MTQRGHLPTCGKQGIRSLCGLLLLLLAACGPEGGTKGHAPAGFEAYLEVAGIAPASETERERALAQYRRKCALASAILATDALDQRLVDAEVENFRTELVLKRYFDQVLEGGLDETALREYYREHADRFGRTWLRFATVASTDTSDENIAKLEDAVRTGKQPGAMAAEFKSIASAINGDEIWYFDRLDPELRELFEGRTRGDVIGPLIRDGMVTIYRIEEGPVLEGSSFDDVRQQIEFILRNEIRQREIDRLLSTETSE